MLVVSRRAGESIFFPSLGITIQIARLRGNSVTLGVDAPKDIKILRGELFDPEKMAAMTADAPAKLGHEIRNRLNMISLSLHTMVMQLEQGHNADRGLLSTAIEELHCLDEAVGSKTDAARGVECPASDRLALLIEDNENESTLLSGFLRHAGFRVVTALDGEAALNFLQISTVMPDIVLMDMNMPGMNGSETVARIRGDEHLCNLNIFAVSGAAPESTTVSIGSDGVNRWFRKPIRPDYLVQEINTMLAAPLVA